MLEMLWGPPGGGTCRADGDPEVVLLPDHSAGADVGFIAGISRSTSRAKRSSHLIIVKSSVYHPDLSFHQDYGPW